MGEPLFFAATGLTPPREARHALRTLALVPTLHCTETVVACVVMLGVMVSLIANVAAVVVGLSLPQSSVAVNVTNALPVSPPQPPDSEV